MKMTDAEKHDHHHSLIESTLQEWYMAPKRSALDKRRRAEKGKVAFNTLRGHLGISHNVRQLGALHTYTQAFALHQAYHMEKSA